MDNHLDAEVAVVIVGMGDVRLGDEGVGVRAVEDLRHSHDFPASVKTADTTAAGLDLLDVLEEASYVIVVDCVVAEEAPGTILRIPLDEFERPGDLPSSLHETEVLEALAVLEMLGRRPPGIVIAVQVGGREPGVGLSAQVSARLPAVVDAILQELAEMGIHPVPKRPPGSGAAQEPGRA